MGLLGGLGLVLGIALHLSQFPVALGTAVSGVHVFPLRGMSSLWSVVLHGGASSSLACLSLFLRVCIDVCLAAMHLSWE